jgi:glycogen debranching enzyme
VASGTKRRSASLLDLMPVVLGEHLPREVFDALCTGVATHLTTVGLATEEPGSPYYEPDGYWRGPVWAPATVLIEDGLRRGGAVDLADRVSARFRATCEKSGFAENFDALTGEGLRDRAYTWTAGAYLLLAGDFERGATPRR